MTELSSLRGSEGYAVRADDVAGMAGLEPTISESKSGVLPLHYIPPSTCAERPALPASRISGVGDGARTHDTRNHNPVLIPTELHPPFMEPCPGTPGGTRTPGLLLRRQLLYPAELLAHIQEPSENGAGEGNRTLVPSLEGWYSTIELHPQAMRAYHYPRRMSRVPERKTLKIRRGMEKFLSDQP